MEQPAEPFRHRAAFLSQRADCQRPQHAARRTQLGVLAAVAGALDAIRVRHRHRPALTSRVWDKRAKRSGNSLKKHGNHADALVLPPTVRDRGAWTGFAHVRGHTGASGACPCDTYRRAAVGA